MGSLGHPQSPLGWAKGEILIFVYGDSNAIWNLQYATAQHHALLCTTLANKSCGPLFDYWKFLATRFVVQVVLQEDWNGLVAENFE